jgi:hypothetical protein
MSAVLGPLHLDQLPKSKPVTPMFSYPVSPWDLRRPQAFTSFTLPVSTRDGQLRFPAGLRGEAVQRPGAERMKLAASGAAEVRGDPLNSRTAKAISPRYPTNQVAHFWCLPEASSVVPTCP